jgi:protein TonB
MRDTIMSVAEQREAFGGPMTGSLLLHVGLVGAVALLVFANTRLHNEWGVNGPQGAIQANLVNSAPTIPLPSITPPTPNVLATEQPSPAPAPPNKETIPITPPDAIPLAAHKPKLRHAMNTSPTHSDAPVQVQGGDFAARFPWYVDKITRLVSQNWYRYQIDPSTRWGTQVSVVFTIQRDGSVSFTSITIPEASPSSTLNKTAKEAVQRVGSFGPLPDQYTGRSVSVEYTFTYDQPSK